MDAEEYFKSINVESICRTCLSDCEEMTSLFSEVVLEELEDEDENYVYLYEIMTYISTMQVATDDGLPTLVCKKCLEYATNAYRFKLNCERTETLLQTYVSRNLKQTESESDNIEVPSEIIELKNGTEINLEDAIVDNSVDTEILSEDLPDLENAEEVPEVIVKPEVDEEQYCEELTFVNCEDSEDDSKSSVAAFVANNEENMRIRERIVMKKINKLKNEEQNDVYFKKRNYRYPFKMTAEGEKIYTCPVCQKEYKHSTSLTVHLRTHSEELPYLCNICGKGFKQFTGLKYHMRSHTGEQPYKCSLCEKKYRQSASLTAHMRVHTGQRPFLCSVCGKGFRQAPDLGYHMRTHTKEKPYMCSVCGKRMSMQCHLVQHMRSHTGEKPYKCDNCGKAFASTTRLKRHAIIHTGLKPYVCKTCGKAFNRSSTLRVHSMIHSEEKPHVCNHCGKGFIQAHCLRTHMNTHINGFG